MAKPYKYLFYLVEGNLSTTFLKQQIGSNICSYLGHFWAQGWKIKKIFFSSYSSEKWDSYVSGSGSNYSNNNNNIKITGNETSLPQKELMIF